MIISLTGFMGCGKSSIGRELSKLLGCKLIDLDEWIETTEGRTIKEIFSTNGERNFRELEVKALRELLPDNTITTEGKSIDMILSLGGGTVTTPEAAKLVHERTLCIYLKASIETLVENLTLSPGDRPMLGEIDNRETLKKRIEELMSRRASIYESTATKIIDIDGKSFIEAAHDVLHVTPLLKHP